MSNEKTEQKRRFEAPWCEIVRIPTGDVLTASAQPGLDDWSPYY